MEEKSFNDFLKDKNIHAEANSVGMKMPKSKEEVDEMIVKITEMASSHGVDVNSVDFAGVKRSLIRKIEIENDVDLLKEIFFAASALAETFSRAKEEVTPSAVNIASLLMMTLTALEEKGVIKIITKDK